MRFFLDTEFIERGRHHPITLISLGIVAENGQYAYFESSEFREEDCSDWVKHNVLPHLGPPNLRMPVVDIAMTVRACVQGLSGDTKPEFWGYYAAYDWVVFAQIFGTMIGLPKGWPMYCRDIKQLCDDLGNPKLPEQLSTEHNALADARWNKQAWEFLQSLKTDRERLYE